MQVIRFVKLLLAVEPDLKIGDCVCGACKVGDGVRQCVFELEVANLKVDVAERAKNRVLASPFGILVFAHECLVQGFDFEL